MSAETLTTPAGKPKFARADALEVARQFVRFLKPHCDRLIVAGSLRRRKEEVSDVEILFIPSFASVPDPNDLFGAKMRANATERAIAALLQTGVLTKRPKCNGTFTWGEQNKLGVHVESGMAVDLFSATTETWFNYLVCRTGPSASNIRICNAAIGRGWQWNPYGEGFTRKPSGAGPGYHDVAPMYSEREVFTFVGLPYLEPWER